MEDPNPQSGEAAQSVEVLKRAYPSPQDVSGWGQITDLPAGHGIFIPFVFELASHDHKTAPEIVSRHFLRCLGSTPDEIIQMFNRFRAEWGVIGRTPIGDQYTHILKTIEIAIQCQGRAFPVFDGMVYTGTAVIGYGFTVEIAGQRVSPVPSERLRSIISEHGAYKSVIRAIANLVGLEDEEWRNGDVTLAGMKDLSNIAKEWVISEADKDEVKKLASKLRLGTAWSINPTTISSALDIISSKNDLDPTSPIHPSMLFENDKVSQVWSCFGTLAPSTNFSSVKMIDLTSAEVPGHIVFTQVALSEAIADMKRSIRLKKVALAPSGKRSGPYKDRVFKGLDAKKIWVAFKKVAGTVQGDGQAADIGRMASGSNVLLDEY